MKQRVFYSKINIIIIFCLLALLIFESGCIGLSDSPVKDNKSDNEVRKISESQNNSNNIADEYNIVSDQVSLSKKKSSFSKYYSKENPQFEAKSVQYSLPLNDSEIANIEDFTQKIPLKNKSKDLLCKNGFVVVNNSISGNGFRAELVNETYRNLKVADVPVFITTDSLLHLFHIQFDKTLKQVEEEELYSELWKLDKALFESFLKDYNRIKEDDSFPNEVKEATRRNVAYFAVALSLLEKKIEPDQIKVKASGVSNSEEYHVEIPISVKEDVEAELELIYRQSPGISPIFNYTEDYSQYVPRGHYTSSEKLERFFRAMMWHGRTSMLLQPETITSEDSEKDARIQTIQAFLISDYFDRDKNLQAGWDRIYYVTAFYVGFSDDLGPYEYAKALDSIFGNDRKGVSFDNGNLTALKAELERYENPKIYGGTGDIIPAGHDSENKTLEDAKGFRFMGQRYTPDSYILQTLYPSALNVMDLLGSERSKEHLKNEGISENEKYKNRHQSLKTEFEAFDEEDWNKNLYWAHLYALKPLLVSYPEGYPTFMQTDAWEDKQLNTALASWTELRHDTILYVKQPYFTGVSPDPPKEKTVQGYVEPVPEFYARILALTKMMHGGLAEMKVLDNQSDKEFTVLENTLEKLLEISIKELENKELTDEEHEFIRNFGQNIAPMLENVDEESQSSVMVADVYTSPAGVLEEGTGKLELIVVAYKQPDGRIVLGGGPVMSYYEFWQPAGDRLTDDEWRDILEKNPPKRPEWIESFKM